LIIPKRDAKSYGAVHIDYYLTFVGFCKKVSSDEIQNIDLFIDGNKIDTIVCDKTIDKVSQIYDIEGHGFEYDLPETYFDKRHLLSFRCSDSGEELVNSPISTICKDDEKFNEYKFMHSLSKEIDTNKLTTLYKNQSIGILGINEFIGDKKFTTYIKELAQLFPNVRFKIFYFNDLQKDIILTIFADMIEKIDLIIPEDIYDICLNIRLMIFNSSESYRDYAMNTSLFLMKLTNILKRFTHIMPIQSNYSLKNMNITQHGQFLYNLNNKAFTGIDDKYKGIHHLSTYQRYFDMHGINETIDLNQNAYEFSAYSRVGFLLNYDGLLEYIQDINIKSMK
jgi:hypothetical protein